MPDTIKWGIIGLGNIAHKFADDLRVVPGAELTAVASRDIQRAEAFANRFHAKKYYGSYEALLADTEVAIVYIATIHPDHARWSIAAMERGKAVLCEKPVGMNTAEVKAMTTVAKAQGVFFMEGLWTRFNPAFIQAKSWIDSGKIGALRYINATFSFYGMDREEDSRVLSLEKGAGALLDIGIYPVFLAYTLLGIPQKIMATALLTEHGVDIQTAIIFEYPEAQAVLYSGITHDEHMPAKICGTAGELYLGSRWHEARELKWVHKTGETTYPFELIGCGFSYEIQEVQKCFKQQATESALWSHQNSLELMHLLDAVRRQCNISYPGD